MNRSFVIKKIEGAVAVKHLREKKHNSIGIIPLVGQLCCSPHSLNSSNYSTSGFVVNCRAFLFTTEVDSYDSISGATVEVKARRKDHFPGIKDLTFKS